MFRKIKEEEKSGEYHFYGEDLDSLTDEEVIDKYMNMINYLSDARTHNF